MCSADSTYSSSARWIAAAIRLREHPGDPVPCPNCDGQLEVSTVAWPDGSHSDMYMKCNKCGASNVMTIKNDGQTT